jgi:hypothetical protein
MTKAHPFYKMRGRRVQRAWAGSAGAGMNAPTVEQQRPLDGPREGSGLGGRQGRHTGYTPER